MIKRMNAADVRHQQKKRSFFYSCDWRSWLDDIHFIK